MNVTTSSSFSSRTSRRASSPTFPPPTAMNLSSGMSFRARSMAFSASDNRLDREAVLIETQTKSLSANRYLSRSTAAGVMGRSNGTPIRIVRTGSCGRSRLTNAAANSLCTIAALLMRSNAGASAKRFGSVTFHQSRKASRYGSARPAHSSASTSARKSPCPVVRPRIKYCKQ